MHQEDIFLGPVRLWSYLLETILFKDIGNKFQLLASCGICVIPELYIIDNIHSDYCITLVMQNAKTFR